MKTITPQRASERRGGGEGGGGLWITDAGLPPIPLTGVDLLETKQHKERKIKNECKKKTLRMLKMKMAKY